MQYLQSRWTPGYRKSLSRFPDALDLFQPAAAGTHNRVDRGVGSVRSAAIPHLLLGSNELG